MMNVPVSIAVSSLGLNGAAQMSVGGAAQMSVGGAAQMRGGATQLSVSAAPARGLANPIHAMTSNVSTPQPQLQRPSQRNSLLQQLLQHNE